MAADTLGINKIKPVKKLNIPSPYLVKVIWYDAHGSSAWRSPEEALEWMLYCQSDQVTNVGWLLHKDDNQILIACGRRDDFQKTPGETIEEWSDLNWIPAPWIHSIKRIKVD